MKVLYDSQAFSIQKFGGISRYIYKLCERGKGLFDFSVSGMYSENIYAPMLSRMKPFPIKMSFKGKSRLIKVFNDFSDSKAIKAFDYDIYHPTYYCVPCFPKKKPVVVTAHDFIHEIYSDSFSLRDNTVACKKISLESADRIIAISERTKEDLLKFYPKVSEEKIDVVHHAIEWGFREKRALQKPFSKPYILFTGQRGRYKNFNAFIKACAPTLLENDLFLVCTGSPFSTEEKAMVAGLNIESRVFQLFADEDELRSLYENALFFCFPSLYEGFGFPILEAFVSECPLLLSDASCFPEIAGDAALYFDPKSEGDLKEKIALIIQSESLRNDLAAKGRERLKKFSLEKMIGETAAVYKKALDNF